MTTLEQYINNLSMSDTNPNIKCAPYANKSVGSCISLNVLCAMATAFNKTETPDKHIKLSIKRETLHPIKYKKYLINEFEKRMKDKCSDQQCWGKQEFMQYVEPYIKEELHKHTFRPKGPEGKFTWLNTFDIINVMEQYWKPEEGKLFWGAIPMDYAKLSYLTHITNANYQELLDNKLYKLGIIFNLDDHDQGGSHWVALYTDLKKGKIYYFDSVAEPPERRVRELMKKQENFMKSIGINTDVNYNKTVHQREGTECGVYSIFFLLRMSVDFCFKEHCKQIVPDKKVNWLRDIIFN
jgi:hypothetical protein